MEMSFAVRRMDDPAEKSAYVRSVLARLPEWFGDAAAVAGYARQAAGLACWAAEMDGDCAGILAAETHYGHTGEVVVCGVLPELHGKGLGRVAVPCGGAIFARGGLPVRGGQDAQRCGGLCALCAHAAVLPAHGL